MIALCGLPLLFMIIALICGYGVLWLWMRPRLYTVPKGVKIDKFHEQKRKEAVANRLTRAEIFLGVLVVMAIVSALVVFLIGLSTMGGT